MCESKNNARDKDFFLDKSKSLSIINIANGYSTWREYVKMGKEHFQKSESQGLLAMAEELIKKLFQGEITPKEVDSCYCKYLKKALRTLYDIVEKNKRRFSLNEADLVLEQVNGILEAIGMIINLQISHKETSFRQLQKTVVDLGNAIKVEVSASVNVSRRLVALLSGFKQKDNPTKARWKLGCLIMGTTDATNLPDVTSSLGIFSGLLLRLNRFICNFCKKFLKLFSSFKLYEAHLSKEYKDSRYKELCSQYNYLGEKILNDSISRAAANQILIVFLNENKRSLTELIVIMQSKHAREIAELGPDIDKKIDDLERSTKKIVEFEPCTCIRQLKNEIFDLVSAIRTEIDCGRELFSASAVAHAYLNCQGRENFNNKKELGRLLVEYDKHIEHSLPLGIFKQARDDLSKYASDMLI